MKISIDSNSGCCHGVKRAIEGANHYLETNDVLFSLGAIVHNNSELSRLSSLGLEIVDLEGAKKLNGSTLLIRAHGEPPSTYNTAQEHNITLIDYTCPVVLQLQRKIKKTYLTHLQDGGQVIIYGKATHAEVIGLMGQIEENGIVIEKIADVLTKLEQKIIDPTRPIFVFSQTTKESDEYQQICNLLVKEAKNKIIIHDTICKEVKNRQSFLKEFAKANSIIIFIGGKESSNGKVLYNLCKSVNPNSHFIEKPEEIQANWFTTNDNVGICGATSTPEWQLEKVFSYICNLNIKH